MVVVAVVWMLPKEDTDSPPIQWASVVVVQQLSLLMVQHATGFLLLRMVVVVAAVSWRVAIVVEPMS